MAVPRDVLQLLVGSEVQLLSPWALSTVCAATGRAVWGSWGPANRRMLLLDAGSLKEVELSGTLL